MAPSTFRYAYLGQEAPQYVGVLLVAFGVVVAGAVVAAGGRRQRRQEKRIPPVAEKRTVEESEDEFDAYTTG